METFIMATHNRHKVTELQRILAPLGIEVTTADLPEVEETGTTFEENAQLKARSCLLYTSTMLQEIIQKNPEESLEYVLTGESGPDHDKHFTVEVHLNSNVIGKGGGRSKKEAEQQAAREALELMGY